MGLEFDVDPVPHQGDFMRHARQFTPRETGGTYEGQGEQLELPPELLELFVKAPLPVPTDIVRPAFGDDVIIRTDGPRDIA